MRTLVITSLFLLAGLVSGCLGGASKAPPPTASTEPPPLVPPDAEWGGIEGLVYGPDVLPIVNVTVEVVDTDAFAVTDADGYYVLLELPPGSYALRVNESGYLPVRRAITITAGVGLRIDFALIEVPRPEPYVDSSFTRRGMLQCEVRANATGQNSNPSCAEAGGQATSGTLPPERESNLTLLPEVGGMVIELEWQSGVPSLHDRLRLALRPVPDITYRQIEGRSVLKLVIGPQDMVAMGNLVERDFVRDGGQIFFLVYPGEAASQNGVGGAGGAFQQSYTLYVTVFYRQPPDPNYSRLA